MADAAEFVEGAKELPVMPPVAAEVMRMAEDPDTDLSAIAELISRDAALALRVLKIANSSFYAMPREVETLQQAIVLLGYSALRSLVVAASMKEVFVRFGLAERLLWEHAVAGAVAANTLASQVGGINADEVFLAGLLHDVGRLVMYTQAEDEYQDVLTAIYSENADPIEAERAAFGFDHCEIGRLVLQKWKIPARLALAIGHHHDPMAASGDEGEKPVAALLQVADRMCLRAGLGRREANEELNPFDCDGARILDLGDLDPEETLASFKEAYEQEKELFS